MKGAVFALTAIHLSPVARVTNAVAGFRAAFAATVHHLVASSTWSRSGRSFRSACGTAIAPSS
jgi:hypothetical protein